jgi:hypothetical protein
MGHISFWSMGQTQAYHKEKHKKSNRGGSEEVGLEVNTENFKHVFMSYHQMTG